jgi:glutaredoxin-like protein NrdH
MVTVYTKPACVQCEQTKRVLTRDGIEFESVDVTVDTAAFDMIVGLGFMSAPVVVTDNGSWAGFRPDKLSELVGRIAAEKASAAA